MQFSHIGWTPCINGHLDFGLVKPGIQGGFTNSNVKDKKTTRINYSYTGIAGSHARKVMLQSKVEWKDTLDKNFDGQMRVFLIAEVAESQFLDSRTFSGSLFLYSEYLMAKKHEIATNWRQKIHKTILPDNYSMQVKTRFPWFQKIHDAKEVFDTSFDDKSERVRQLDIKFDELKNELRAINDICHEIFFKVSAQGLTYLRLSDHAMTVLGLDEQYAILRQAFYYIKYSIHDHKHHDGQVDSLTTIIQFDDSSGGKRDAAFRLVGQLKRELTQIKRTYSSGDKYYKGDALGIIAYTRSLCVTLKSAGFFNDKNYLREIAYLDALAQSFKAQIDKIDKADKYRELARSTSRVHLGWIFTVCSLAGLFLYRAYVSVPEGNVINLPASNALMIFLSVLIIIFFAYEKYSKFQLNTHLHDGAVKFWINDNYLKKARQYYSKKIAIMTFHLVLGFSLLAFSLCIYLMYKSPPFQCVVLDEWLRTNCSLIQDLLRDSTGSGSI